MDNHNLGQKPPNIFKSFLYAFIPTKYNRLIKVKTGSMIGFVILLVLIATLADAVVFGIRYRYTDPFWVEFPNIVVTDGKLHIDEDFLSEKYGFYIFVTDDVDEFSYADVKALADSGYRQVMLVGRDKIAMMRQGKYEELYFADIVGRGEQLVAKDWFEGILRDFIWVFGVVLFVIYVLRVLWYFLCSAVCLIIGMIIAQMYGKWLQTGQIFRIAVYSKAVTFAVTVFVDVVSFMHSSVPVFIRCGATIILMVAAIRFMPQEDKNSRGGEGEWERTVF